MTCPFENLLLRLIRVRFAQVGNRHHHEVNVAIFRLEILCAVCICHHTYCCVIPVYLWNEMDGLNLPIVEPARFEVEVHADYEGASAFQLNKTAPLHRGLGFLAGLAGFMLLYGKSWELILLKHDTNPHPFTFYFSHLRPISNNYLSQMSKVTTYM
jgi:hypothetical protein